MKIKMLLLAAVLIALVGGGTAQAQDGGWSVWLMDMTTQQMVRVYLDGRVETFTPDIPEAAFPSAFTPDGRMLAMCEQSQAGSSLIVYDIEGDAEIVNVPIPGESTVCNVTPNAFNEDASRIAFGTIEAQANADGMLTPSGWSLVVVEVPSGQIAYTLRSDDASVANLGGQWDYTGGTESIGFMPFVWNFEAGQVTFTPTPWGTEVGAGLDAVVWDMNGGALQLTDRYHGRWVFDELPNGEMTWTQNNPELPALMPMGPGEAANVVMYTDGAQQPYMIHHSPDMTLVQSVFVNNGQHIAAFMSGDFNPDTGAMPTKWAVIGRDGLVQQIPERFTEYNLRGAPDGFVIMHVEYGDSVTSELLYGRFVEGGLETSVLWSAQSDIWQMLWADEMPVNEGLSAFPAVNP